MKLTTNYSLKKPEGSDVVNIEDFNYNADMIDTLIKEVKDTSATNKINISSLQTKVDNGQNHKLTKDNGTGIQISESDLNELTKCGTYYGWGLVNAPTSAWYYVEVFVRDTNYVYQRIVGLNDQNMTKLERVMRDGVWESWKEIQTHKLTQDNGYSITKSQGDMNALIANGFYYVAGGKNAPVNSSNWYVEVMAMNDKYIYQRATRNSSGNDNLEKYERTMYNNTWTAWREL